MTDPWKKHAIGLLTITALLAVGYVWATLAGVGTVSYSNVDASQSGGEVPIPIAASSSEVVSTTVAPWPAPLDTAAYDARMLELVRYVPPSPITSTTTNERGEVVSKQTTPPSPLTYSSSTSVTIQGKRWPAAAPYPHGGAILPFHRILAYYGNLYSTRMGILGELPPKEMLAHLAATKAKWEAADPETPVMPAIQYIAIVAQGSAGADGKYRAVMPDTEIEKAYALAKEANGIFILDLQVGLSTIQAELPKFKKYLERPDVHLGIDPEFSMKGGEKPGTVIGTYDAADVNYAINYLADIVRERQLPPKVLIVHRFTQDMVTGVSHIAPKPEVQVVMHMDGWGPKENKIGTYTRVIEPVPVQFTGVKIFYKNDLKPPSTGLLSPAEVLGLTPKPVYIQYQ